MSFGDKETDNDFIFFKMRREDYVLFNNYIKFISIKLNKSKKQDLLKYLNKAIRLIIPADLKKDEEQQRRINEITIKVIRYFKEDGEYYFKPDNKHKISFEKMIEESVSQLVLFEEINILEKNRDEWIRGAYFYLSSYAEIHNLEKPYKLSNYAYKAISCYISICAGFHIGSKKITNPKLFQAARNAFKTKKSDRRVKNK